jgi:hypothetical protein
MRTIIRGKRIIPPAISDPPKRNANVVGPAPGLVRIMINGYTFVHDAKPAHTIGNILIHAIPDLHYKSVSAMLAALTAAEQLLSQISDKSSKQIQGIRKVVDHARLRTQEDPENPIVREHLITYITELVMRCEGLGVLHGFYEIMPKLK